MEGRLSRADGRRGAARWLLALFYAVAGYFHLATPAPFLRIMPEYVPHAEAVVLFTGVAELLGAAGLIQPWSQPLRRWAGAGLAIYALCVWPANFQHLALDSVHPDGGMSLAYHIPRLALQPLIIWLALWASGATDWPLRRRKAD
ncbi:DoxX family protein [Tsuneonella sp. HG249]